MQFKIGQSVVHNSHGMGIIKSVEEREFTPGKIQKFYVMEVKDNGAPKKIFIPFDSAALKLRHIMDKNTAESVLCYVAFGKPDAELDVRTWNMRYRGYMERINSGDPMEVAKVYVSLRALQAAKDLSFGERKLAEHAKELLQRELEGAGFDLPQE